SRRADERLGKSKSGNRPDNNSRPAVRHSRSAWGPLCAVSKDPNPRPDDRTDGFSFESLADAPHTADSKSDSGRPTWRGTGQAGRHERTGTTAAAETRVGRAHCRLQTNLDGGRAFGPAVYPVR